MRVGTHFYQPPRMLVLRIEQRIPGFWAQLAASIDRAIAGRNVTLTNWYRDPAHNARVGGAPGSQHRWGTAIDVAGPDQALVGAALKADGWKVLDEGDHVHAQAFDPGALARAGIAPG